MKTLPDAISIGEFQRCAGDLLEKEAADHTRGFLGVALTTTSILLTMVQTVADRQTGRACPVHPLSLGCLAKPAEGTTVTPI
jgi:hypothetical protein